MEYNSKTAYKQQTIITQTSTIDENVKQQRKYNDTNLGALGTAYGIYLVIIFISMVVATIKTIIAIWTVWSI